MRELVPCISRNLVASQTLVESEVDTLLSVSVGYCVRMRAAHPPPGASLIFSLVVLLTCTFTIL